ncbi:MAG: EI24 domain-containing protein [Timaviella obliquedivisa GSE-PSE-MK23-08B]|jgi:CysZ protein|nr:EI24 domain-containing protein [Timaviella obliquedivisa GSE-PSE-MK23-08B]
MTSDPNHKFIVKRGPGSFFAGAVYPFRALALFAKTPRLRRYVLFPIAVNLLVGGTIYAALLFAGFRAIDTIVADVPNWTGNLAHLSPHLPAIPPISLPQVSLSPGQMSFPDWLPHWNLALPDWQLPSLPSWNLRAPGWAIAIADTLGASFLWILRLLLVLILLLVTGFIFLQFGVLLGAPWYGKLSEELELLKLGKLPPMDSSLSRTVQDVGRAILYELKKLVLLISVGLPLLLFNFLPGIGTAIASVGYLTLTATIVCLDFFDSALERRRLRFRQKLGVVLRSLPASAAFGLVCLVLVSVPLINLLAIPVCVAAGTLFFCDRIQPWLDP